VEALDGSFRWRCGEPIDDLKGTARTLDNADGAVALEPGLLSRSGFTVLDDSDSALLTEDGWVKKVDRAGVSNLYFLPATQTATISCCLRDSTGSPGGVSTPLLPSALVFVQLVEPFLSLNSRGELSVSDGFVSGERYPACRGRDRQWTGI
jgi:hypothetical protein